MSNGSLQSNSHSTTKAMFYSIAVLFEGLGRGEPECHMCASPLSLAPFTRKTSRPVEASRPGTSRQKGGLEKGVKSLASRCRFSRSKVEACRRLVREVTANPGLFMICHTVSSGSNTALAFSGTTPRRHDDGRSLMVVPRSCANNSRRKYLEC